MQILEVKKRKNEKEIWDDESPEINGLTITVFTGNETEGERIGSAMVLKPEKLIGIYNQALMGAEMKKLLGKLTDEEKEKNKKRKTRVSKLREVLLKRK